MANGHGGARQGAGRKPGVKNLYTTAQKDAVAASGETPLDFLLRYMRDETQPVATRLSAAKDAAPYVHSRLAAVDATLQANLDGSITFTWLPTDGEDGGNTGADG